jgi:hypothetical protein
MIINLEFTNEIILKIFKINKSINLCPIEILI